MNYLFQFFKRYPKSLSPILMFLFAALVVLVVAGYTVIVGPFMLRP